mmetsp:Transcript_40218/g.94542  ORF Transcript_40218/g.94542 Transcript_40218/m.94542 type:complete len:288 (-) Transcript_40218:388-1251(-)
MREESSFGRRFVSSTQSESAKASTRAADSDKTPGYNTTNTPSCLVVRPRLRSASRVARIPPRPSTSEASSEGRLVSMYRIFLGESPRSSRSRACSRSSRAGEHWRSPEKRTSIVAIPSPRMLQRVWSSWRRRGQSGPKAAALRRSDATVAITSSAPRCSRVSWSCSRRGSPKMKSSCCRSAKSCLANTPSTCSAATPGFWILSSFRVSDLSDALLFTAVRSSSERAGVLLSVREPSTPFSAASASNTSASSFPSSSSSTLSWSSLLWLRLSRCWRQAARMLLSTETP